MKNYNNNKKNEDNRVTKSAVKIVVRIKLVIRAVK